MTRLALRFSLVLAIAGALVWPATAGATPAASQSALGAGLALPLQDPPSLAYVPPGFSSSAQQAIDAAKATRELQALHATHHPLLLHVQIWNGSRWEVDFYFKRKLLAETDVSRSGHVTATWTGPLAVDYAGRGHFAGLFDSPWVLLPFALLFLLPFVDWRRPFRIAHLDLLALLSFGISYWRFNNTHFESAVLLVYPPLLYLLARMLALGLRWRSSGPALTSRLPVKALAAGLIVLVGARIGLDLANDKVIDVGYASVIGADRIVHGLSLYYASGAHGETYGPAAYLAYVPFERLFPWSGSWDYLPAAHAAAIAFDLLTILGLVALGVRLRGRAAGLRLGLSLAWLYAAFPFTLFGLMNNTNDGLIAMLLVFCMLALASPAARGALLALAAAAKFFPVALLPVIARGAGNGPDDRRTRKSMLISGLAFAAVVGLATLPFLPSGGISELYDHTIGFQLGRSDVFSLWGLHPSLDWLKTVVLVAALGLAALVALLPRGQRTIAQVAALSAAIVIAIQLPAEHWFYFYIVWFAPLVLVALLAREPAVAKELEPARAVRGEPRRPEPVAVAV
jgi:Glycosyltransferase family 87